MVARWGKSVIRCYKLLIYQSHEVHELYYVIIKTLVVVRTPSDVSWFTNP